MGSSPHLWFCAFKTVTLGPKLHVSMGPSTYLWFLHAKQRDCTRMKSLCGFQLSPVIFCMQNRVISTRITSLYASQPLSVVFACKTAWFALEWKVCVGSSYHLWFSACKTAWLAPELLVSMGPSPHLWFLGAKQRLLDQNYKSLWVPDLTCRFVHATQRN